MSKTFEERVKELYKNKMDYPQGFIDKCLLTYPNDEKIKQLLKDKSFELGKELERRSKKKDSEELYNDFIDLYKEQYLSKGLYIDEYGLVSEGLLTKLNYDISRGNTKMKKEDKISSADLANLQHGVSKKLVKKESRRIHGADEAGQYRTR